MGNIAPISEPAVGVPLSDLIEGHLDLVEASLLATLGNLDL